MAHGALRASTQFCHTGDSQTRILNQQLHAAAAHQGSPDPSRAALDMLTNMARREADVIAANQMFLLLGGIFFTALLHTPLGTDS